MKFMKLGSKPDTFYTTESIRSVSSEVSSDLIVQVKGCRYLLHKFPLLSKSLRLQILCAENPEPSQPQIIQLPDFPGGIETFELCAKFCYNITITLSAYNVVASRCAAEYLQMTEDVEKGNLISKIDAFFNSCILPGWKDTIVALLSTKSFVSLSEELGITSRCIEAISSKVLEKPSKTSYSRKGKNGVSGSGSCSGSGIESNRWWAEDVAELGIDLYWRTMIAIKSGGKVSSSLIGDALRIYATRWLPNRCNQFESKHKVLLESIVSLLPPEKHAVSCRFLSKLLQAANIVKASSSTKLALAKKLGIQLDHATVNDLLIPLSSSSGNNIICDVDIVITMLEQFMLQPQSPPTSPLKIQESMQKRRSFSADNIDFELQERRRSSSSSNTHSSKLKVAKIVDGYLQEIAKDVNLPMNKFMAVAEIVPEFARVDHDDLYKAIDIYLKAHQELNKSERKRLCKILDCRKLSMQTCTHAAQNELLPLRLVVQVLFFEQARSTISGAQTNNELPRRITALLSTQDDDHSSKTATSFNNNNNRTTRVDDQWSVSATKSSKTTVSTLKMKMDDNDDDDDDDDHVMVGEKYKTSKAKSFCMIPYRPKRMLSKLWPVNRSVREKNSM